MIELLKLKNHSKHMNKVKNNTHQLLSLLNPDN